jgi:hypothetical protein
MSRSESTTFVRSLIELGLHIEKDWELWEQCVDYTTEAKTKKGNALCIAFLSFIRLSLSEFKLRVLKAGSARKI